MDDEMQAIEVRDAELERRFEAFARFRLTPDSQAIARIRARVMREARLRHEAVRIAAYVVPVVEARRRSPFRRVAMPLLAAAVWMAIAVGTIAAAQPGGALYSTRLWVERATLPSMGSARVDADLRNLDDRISEALAAASANDRGALSAALDAYGFSADDATTSSAGDAALGTRVEDALARHQAVLTALVTGLTARGNDTAAAALERNIERALDHTAAVLAALETRRGGGDASNGGGNGGSGSAGASGTHGGNGGSVGAGGGVVTSGQGTGSGTSGATTGTGGTGAGAGKGGTAGAGGGGGASTGGASGPTQSPGGADGGNGGQGGDGGGAADGSSGSRPTDAPATSAPAPDHTPR